VLVTYSVELIACCDVAESVLRAVFKGLDVVHDQWGVLARCAGPFLNFRFSAVGCYSKPAKFLAQYFIVACQADHNK